MNNDEVLIRLTIAEAEATQYAAMAKCEWWRAQALLGGGGDTQQRREWLALAAASFKIGEARLKTMGRMEREAKP